MPVKKAERCSWGDMSAVIVDGQHACELCTLAMHYSLHTILMLLVAGLPLSPERAGSAMHARAWSPSHLCRYFS